MPSDFHLQRAPNGGGLQKTGSYQLDIRRFRETINLSTRRICLLIRPKFWRYGAATGTQVALLIAAHGGCGIRGMGSAMFPRLSGRCRKWSWHGQTKVRALESSGIHGSASSVIASTENSFILPRNRKH